MALESLEVEGVQFAATIESPTSHKELVLAGAGYRGIEVAPGEISKVTSIAIYVEDELLEDLPHIWRSKSSSLLAEDDQFLQHIVSTQFEKCAKVALLEPLTGVQYSERVLQDTKAELGEWDDEDTETAIGEFLGAFRDRIFLPGSAILLFVSPDGLTICCSFASDPDAEIQEIATIHNTRFAEAVLSTILGKQSVAPDVKASVASRISSILSTNLQKWLA